MNIADDHVVRITGSRSFGPLLLALSEVQQLSVEFLERHRGGAVSADRGHQGLHALSLGSEGRLALFLGGQRPEAGTDIALERKVGTHDHERNKGGQLHGVRRLGLPGQRHADQQADDGHGGWEKSVNASQTLHVQQG